MVYLATYQFSFFVLSFFLLLLSFRYCDYFRTVNTTRK